MINKTSVEDERESSWDRKIRKSYWFIFLLILLSSFASWPFMQKQSPEMYAKFLKDTLILQNGLIFAVLIGSELIFRTFHQKIKYKDYIMIVIGCLISCTVFIFVPHDAYGTQVVMLLPILISILYFSYQKVLFACILSLIIYILSILMFFSLENEIYHFSSVICMMVLCTLFAVGIVNRGLKIIKAEEEVLHKEKELILQKLFIDKLVRTDALTGLNNHKTFQERLHQLLVDNETNQPLHLAIIDIDDFKQVNDTYGHSSGDVVLRRIGTMMVDFSGENAFASRYGGEEFTVIFTGLETSEVLVWLENFRSRVEQMDFPGIDDVNITVSIGCYQMQSEENAEMIFKHADQALYQAKHFGKNRLEWS